MRATRHQLSLAIRATLVAAFLSSAASAQQTPAEGDEAKTLDAVQVTTGTRISGPGTMSNSPISSFTAEDIKYTQSVSVEDFIKTLPGAVPAIGPGTNNGSGGAATIDLRGLGSNRVLVLIDGRRVVPFNLNGDTDTNSIPIAMIERVDLVTGGASAVYGADAISGVVNFILKKDFDGALFSAQYGVSEKGDATRSRIDATIGGNLSEGRGNVVFSVGHTDNEALLQGDRRFGEVSRSSTTGNPQGSGTNVPLNLFDVSGNFVGLCANGSLDENCAGSFNFNPKNLYQTPLDRIQASVKGNFFLTSEQEVYGDLLYVRSDVGTQLAPSGTFFNDYYLPIGNAYLPNAARQQLCDQAGIPTAQCVVGNTTEVLIAPGRRLVELGPRGNTFENETFQGTLGFRGPLIGTWSYDAYYSRGETKQIATLDNWGSSSRVQQALRAVSTTTCLNASNGCVPINLFGNAGSITPEMVNFINLDSISTTKVTQTVASASANGDFGDLKAPWTDYSIGAAFGYEYREVTAQTRADAAARVYGEVLGTDSATPEIDGRFDLSEIYGEVIVPLVNDKRWAKSVSLEAGYRYSRFDSGVSDSYDTFKIGGEWAPIEGLRFRLLKQRATRAPNIGELFSPVQTSLDNLATDPCQGSRINAAQANTAGTLSNLCRQTGVPLSVIGNLAAPSAGQVNIRTGGNPALGPEVGNTVTAGLVWEPAFVDGLTLTLDYYKIRLTDAVSSPSVADIVEDCYNPQRNPGYTFNAACAAIGRNPNNGTFNGTASRGIALLTSNLGLIKTDGIDLGANYRWDLGEWGGLTVASQVNRTLEWASQATPNSVNRGCVGYYSVACGAGINKWKANVRTTWDINDFAFSLNTRYISSMQEEPGDEDFLPAYSSIGSYTYFDLTATWSPLEAMDVTLTIDNLFDKQPPEVGNTIGSTAINSGNTFPQYYDTLGRYYTLGVSYKF